MILLLAACDPYAAWPEREEAYPWVVSAEPLQDWERVRWEEGTGGIGDPVWTAGYLRKSFEHRQGAPGETRAHFERMRTSIPPLADGMVAGLVGDVMYIDQDDWSTYAEPAAPLLAHADLRLGNVETPTSPDHPTTPRALGLYAFNAPPAMLDSLPLDVVQLNNNHSLDAGDDGLGATLVEVEARGMVPVGVDSHGSVDVDGRSIAVLSYTWGLNDDRTSNRYELFVVPFGQLGEVPLDGLLLDVEEARLSHDVVIVMLHWGYEYEYYPDARFMRFARRIVAAGADVVAGEGPHVVQPAELCFVNHPEVVPGIGTCSVRGEGEPRQAAVFYSLGDFGSEVVTVAARVGIVGSVSIGSQGVSGMGWEGAATILGGTTSIQPLETVQDAVYVDEELRLEQHLGEEWKR